MATLGPGVSGAVGVNETLAPRFTLSRSVGGDALCQFCRGVHSASTHAKPTVTMAATIHGKRVSADLANGDEPVDCNSLTSEATHDRFAGNSPRCHWHPNRSQRITMSACRTTPGALESTT